MVKNLLPLTNPQQICCRFAPALSRAFLVDGELPHSWTQPKGCLCCSWWQTQKPARLVSKVSNLYTFPWFSSPFFVFEHRVRSRARRRASQGHHNTHQATALEIISSTAPSSGSHTSSPTQNCTHTSPIYTCDFFPDQTFYSVVKKGFQGC